MGIWVKVKIEVLFFAIFFPLNFWFLKMKIRLLLNFSFWPSGLHYATAAALTCSTNAQAKDWLFINQGPTLIHAMLMMLFWYLLIWIYSIELLYFKPAQWAAINIGRKEREIVKCNHFICEPCHGAEQWFMPHYVLITKIVACVVPWDHLTT